MLSQLTENFQAETSIALQESFHLSFPNVFRYKEEYYMIPEAWESGELRLYHATDFPFGWEWVYTISTKDYADPQIFRTDGLWYLFLTSDPLENKTCEVFYSTSLFEEWRPHSENPIIFRDASKARSAGRFFSYRGELFRFFQDCSKFYGERIGISRVNKISPKHFEEEFISHLNIRNSCWNQKANHHIEIFQKNDKLYCLYDGY